MPATMLVARLGARTVVVMALNMMLTVSTTVTATMITTEMSAAMDGHVKLVCLRNWASLKDRPAI